MLVSMFGIIGCAHSKDDNDIKIAMLKEFYIAYNVAWGSASDFNIMIKQLDSLQRKYCSKEFKKELDNLFESYGISFDIILDNIRANEKYLEEISIVEDVSRDNLFIVSYTGINKDNNFKPIDKEVNLQVEVLKEGDEFKINDVKPMH